MIGTTPTRVLVVDDDPNVAEVVGRYLEREGFEVELLGDGQLGLERALAEPPDVLILDLMLPGLDGLEVCRRLRALAPVPVIMLTAKGDEADRVLGLELGADDYVAKPFSPRELVARVRGVLRRTAKGAGVATAAAPAPPLPIAVDEGRMQIRYHGRLLELSRYEYGLLKTLASRPGHVFSRDALLERVWGNDTESMDRTVDAHVKTVRAKMKAIAPDEEPIRTHRGSGYSLAEDLPTLRAGSTR